MLFGAVALFVLYTTALSVLLRNAACAWLALYMACFALLLALRQGFARELGGAGLVSHLQLTMVSAMGLLSFSGAKLLRVFLKVQRHAPRADQVLRGLQWLGVAFLPIWLFAPRWVPATTALLCTAGPVFGACLALRFWWKGIPNARFLSLGWLAAQLPFLIEPLRLGALPSVDLLLPASLGLVILFLALAIIEQTYNTQLFAQQDSLTGLANRRRLHQHLENEWARNRRHADPISLLRIDVDCFQAYNDHYGRNRGDHCLEAIARTLRRFGRRQGDLCARTGRDEFAVLLSGTEPQEARRLAEEMRARVAELALPYAHSPVAPVVTASFGLATGVPGGALTPESLLQRADHALYHAKRLGRNRVALASEGGAGKPEKARDTAV